MAAEGGNSIPWVLTIRLREGIRVRAPEERTGKGLAYEIVSDVRAAASMEIEGR
jgi:hypothetical protein